MDSMTSESWIELSRTISLTVFLLFAWYKEREERIKRTDAYIDHLEGDKEGKQELTDSLK